MVSYIKCNSGGLSQKGVADDNTFSWNRILINIDLIGIFIDEEKAIRWEDQS